MTLILVPLTDAMILTVITVINCLKSVSTMELTKRNSNSNINTDRDNRNNNNINSNSYSNNGNNKNYGNKNITLSEILDQYSLYLIPHSISSIVGLAYSLIRAQKFHTTKRGWTFYYQMDHLKRNVIIKIYLISNTIGGF